MHVIRNTEEIRKFIGEKKTAVALGAFDGLHIGHYKVIRTAVESGLTPVVFTFRDNPAEYLTGTCCYLTTVEERMRILESAFWKAGVWSMSSCPILHRSQSGPRSALQTFCASV